MIDLIKRHGIPIAKPDAKFSPGKYTNQVKSFLLSDTNLLVIGQHQYLFCAKLMRMKLATNLSAEVRWYTQSSLPEIWKMDLSDVVCIVNISPETVDSKLSKLGSVVSKLLANRTQVLLGVKNTELLNETIREDADVIEANFDVWKI